MIGMFAGDWLRCEGADGPHKVRGLLLRESGRVSDALRQALDAFDFKRMEKADEVAFRTEVVRVLAELNR